MACEYKIQSKAGVAMDMCLSPLPHHSFPFLGLTAFNRDGWGSESEEEQ